MLHPAAASVNSIVAFHMQIETDLKSKATSLACSLSEQQTQVSFTIVVQDMTLMPSAEDDTMVCTSALLDN